MMPSETPSNTTTTYRWARESATIAGYLDRAGRVASERSWHHGSLGIKDLFIGAWEV